MSDPLELHWRKRAQAAEAQLAATHAAIRALRALVDEQAEDGALWCVADSIVEAYIQQELRRLHDAAEALARLLGDEQP